MFTADSKTLSRLAPVVRRVVVVDPNASAARLMTDIVKGFGAREVYVEGDEDLAMELIRDGIVVSGIAPGPFGSEMNVDARDNAEQVARRVPRRQQRATALSACRLQMSGLRCGLKPSS